MVKSLNLTWAKQGDLVGRKGERERGKGKMALRKISLGDT
jgi:hypothetical protein